MVTTQDASIGVATESTYGTFATPTRWAEFVDESLQFQKNIKQGQGLRVGSRVARSARRTVPTADAGGDITLELASKGMGLFWQYALGAGSSALVSGSTQQQLFTLGDTPPSFTLQKGIPRADGTVDPYTFLGCMVSQWSFNFPNDDIANLKLTIDARDITTAQAYATPSYPAAPVNLFHFAGGSVLSGTLTAPTATVLAGGSTPLANVRGGALTVNNNLRNDRFNMDGTGRKTKPTVGLRDISGNLDLEYTSAAARDAVLNESPLLLVLQYVGGSLSTGLETLQVVVPEVKYDNQLPVSNGPNLAMQSINFAGLDNLTAAQPLWVVARTADAAL